jgi:hypothetical protein
MKKPSAGEAEGEIIEICLLLLPYLKATKMCK